MAEASEKPGPQSGRGRARVGPAEAAILETFVVPRYLTLFGELALEMLAESAEAQVVHLGCRTGYPDRGLAMRLSGAHVYGTDSSSHALELARAKAATMPGFVAQYVVAEGFPTPLPAGAFSHALSLHPLANPADRGQLLAECARLLAPQGQALVAMPLRGSFQEIGDLLREYALKYEADAFGKSIEAAAHIRPSVEMFGAELEEAGFHYVDVEMRTHTLQFQSGRDFFEDPVTRLLILPEVRLNLNLGGEVGAEGSRASVSAIGEIGGSEKPFAYMREAIDKYWSEGTFELTVNVGCASGRRVA